MAEGCLVSLGPPQWLVWTWTFPPTAPLLPTSPHCARSAVSVLPAWCEQSDTLLAWPVTRWHMTIYLARQYAPPSAVAPLQVEWGSEGWNEGSVGAGAVVSSAQRCISSAHSRVWHTVSAE